MLESLDSVFEQLATLGWGIALVCAEHPYAVAALATIPIVGIASRTRDAGRTLYVLSPIGIAAFAQAALLSDHLVVGGVLFALAFAFAFHFGRVNVHEGLPQGFNGIVQELPFVLSLGVFAAALRIYAIEEIPWFVDVEPGAAYVQSLSPHGLARYVTFNRVLDDGFVHMIGRWLTGLAMGPSIVSLRLVSVTFGVMAVVLCYLMARLIAPRFFAVIVAALLATDSAHLFWSRIEASQIVASSSAAFIGGILGLWLIRTWSMAAAVATMLWIPATRYFYAGTLALPLLPALIVVAGLWRRDSRLAASRVAPICLIGGLLWLNSSALLHSAAVGEWEFLSPLRVYGRPMYHPHDPENRYVDLSGIDVVKVQAERLATNSMRLFAHMAYDRPRFSNWLMMTQPDPGHMRSVSAGVFAALVPSLGFVFGSAGSAPSSVVVLLWLATLAIPGLFSEDPEPRRVVGLMVGVYVVIALYLACVVRSLAEDGHRRSLRDCLIVAAIALSLTAVASHLLTGRQATGISRYIEVMGPVYRDHDSIFHNIDDAAVAATLAFGNSEIFTKSLPCFAFLSAEAMPARDVSDCSFDSSVYQDLLPESYIARRGNEFRARSVAFVLELVRPEDFSTYSSLREAWPGADITIHELFLPPRGLTSVVILSIQDAYRL